MKNTGNNEIKSLSHSTYRCQYHIVFAPKYRRKEIYGQIKKLTAARERLHEKVMRYQTVSTTFQAESQ